MPANYNARGKKLKKKKEPVWAKLLLAVVSLFSVILTLLVHVMERQNTVKVIKNEDTMTLIKAQKETKSL